MLESKVEIVNGHNEVYKYWLMLNPCTDLTCFHIDAHSDIYDGFPKKIVNSDKELSIANFLSAGIYNGIFNRLIWYNPHSRICREYYFPNPKDYFYIENERVMWVEDIRKKIKERNFGEIRNISEIKFNSLEEIVLDIDLDAFCCVPNTDNGCVNDLGFYYDGSIDWQRRVDETFEHLHRIVPFNLIRLTTFAQSQETEEFQMPFVPKDSLQYVENRVMNKLLQINSHL